MIINRRSGKAACKEDQRIDAARRQDYINRAVYYSPGIYRHYLSPILKPAEIACLLKYSRHILGHDVLDVGVGAGRTTRYLAPLARRYEAIDYSPVMVNYMKKALVGVSIQQADFRDLGIFADGSFDFVLATDNVIDALSHEDRLRALSEAGRVLRGGGMLAFSSHNLHYKNAFAKPGLDWSLNPLRIGASIVRYPVCLWNHLRLASFRTTTPEYALINDSGHHYAVLHYYAARPTVQSQLGNTGFRLREVFDHLGQVMPEAAESSEAPWLFYVAERVLPDSGTAE